ncbi:MAG: GNAT family N-acetyltransferase [Acidobacteriaceae bacterium]
MSNLNAGNGVDRLVVRACSGFEELDACVDLQRQTWGNDDEALVPRRVFVVTRRIGGQAIGAFTESGAMAGFAMALPGWRNGQVYLHSHKLAVRPEYRNRGVGRRLKLAQRADALERGIRLMEWTFDPLEIKNAFFNVEKLGAIARSYSSNFYGVSSARLQDGLPSDRLHAEWWLDSERVMRALAGECPSAERPHSQVEDRIELPAGVMEWKESAARQERALAVQTMNRERFQMAFARGLAVIGFVRDQAGNGIFELGRWNAAGPEQSGQKEKHAIMSEVL